MSRLDRLTGFRGGVLYGAADVVPTTARTWPISLGQRAGEGHKRYDAMDVVALTLMRDLAQEHGIGAAHAAAIVNCLRKPIAAAMSALVAEQASNGKWRWHGGPYVLINPRRGIPVGEWLHIVEDDIVSALGHLPGGGVSVIIVLPKLINKALYQLERVLAGEKPVASED